MSGPCLHCIDSEGGLRVNGPCLHCIDSATQADVHGSAAKAVYGNRWTTALNVKLSSPAEPGGLLW